ncbi:MAG TPA: ATP-binding protein, partial [Solirubrobacteraceae bacterium]|nr:ATP-binding protein [Solirubrobacteraceae bacterium]
MNKSNRSSDAATRLVGRAQEIARVERLLRATDASYPRVLQITGEAGIGKTHLLAVAVERASD